jgi:hypothetical protein
MEGGRESKRKSESQREREREREREGGRDSESECETRTRAREAEIMTEETNLKLLAVAAKCNESWLRKLTNSWWHTCKHSNYILHLPLGVPCVAW